MEFLWGDASHQCTVENAQNDPARPKVVLTPKSKHTSTVFFFHGLGDTAKGWKEGLQQWASQMPTTKFIAPTAPTIPVTLNGGARTSAWFDLSIKSMSPQDMLNIFLTKPPGIDQSAQYVMDLILAEVNAGIPLSRIVLGGFSMGSFLAVWIALQLEWATAGVIMLSGMLFGPNHIKVVPKVLTTPFLYYHGDADHMIPLFAAQMSKQKLEEFGVKVEFKTFPGLGHSVSNEELSMVTEWLRAKLPSEVDCEALKQEAADQSGISLGAKRLKPNTKVILRGLKRAELNGAVGVVQSYDFTSDRYAVILSARSAGNTVALKAINLIQPLQVTHDDEDVEIEDVDVEAGTYTLRDKGCVGNAEVRLPTGSLVRSEGLTSEKGKRLNGLYGEVLSFDRETQRYLVNFGTVETKVKPVNLFP